MQSVLTRSETVLGGAERLAAVRARPACSDRALRLRVSASACNLAAAIECIRGAGGEYLEPFCKAAAKAVAEGVPPQ